MDEYMEKNETHSRNIPRPEFPRPDFIRERWESLNGEWEFSFDEPVFDRKILVPFVYQSVMSGIGEEEDHDVVWYRRRFWVEREGLAEGRLLLKFGAVDWSAQIWINGVLAGDHKGGYTPFELDITELVTDGANEIQVKAEDFKNADKPRGKQTWTGERFGCWYTPMTGIWQSVWLEYTGKTYITKIKITPNINDLSALCEIFLSCDGQKRAQVRLYRDEGRVLMSEQMAVCCHGYGKVSFTFPDYDLRRDLLLWTPKTPNLLDVVVELEADSILGRNEGGSKTPEDRVQTYFGMRSIEASRGRLVLNGSDYYQRLVLDQGYWPDSLLTPPTDEAIKKDILLTKEMGFNGARKHQKIEDPRYYYWADKLGLLVWGELPSAYEFNDRAIKASVGELMAFVERDYNHPCIVTWVPINESWGVRLIKGSLQQQNYSRMLLYLLKSMDPTRLVSANDGWEQVSETDICAIHDYALFPDSIEKYDIMNEILRKRAESRMVFADGQEYQGQPVVLTEYGGIAFEEDNSSGWGYYGRVKDEEQFLERLRPITEFLLRSGKFSGFCYTQLTDVMQEVNGLLSPDRVPKISVKCLAEIFGGRTN